MLALLLLGTRWSVKPFLRMVTVGVLLFIMLACVYLAIAAREAPRDTWWAYWTAYGVIGLACAVTLLRVLRGRRP